MVWSLDLSPIKHVWRIMKETLNCRAADTAHRARMRKHSPFKMTSVGLLSSQKLTVLLKEGVAQQSAQHEPDPAFLKCEYWHQILNEDFIFKNN